MDKELFRKNARDYALQLVEEGRVSADALLLAALVYMSTDDVREMLDMNELSPRFADDEEEELEEEELDPMDDFNYVGSRHHY